MARSQGKEYMGNVCAYIKEPGAEKGSYKRIGIWFQNDEGQISAVLDSIPLPHTAWKGWINLFPKDNGFSQNKPAGDRTPPDVEDDIPF